MTCSQDTERYKDLRDGKKAVLLRDALHHAIVGNTEELRAVVQQDRDILSTAGEQKHTLLYIAARNGYADMVSMLLSLGCNVNAKQSTGSTPLHGASFYSHGHVVQLLLECGADPTLKNNYNSTPAEEASADLLTLFEQIGKDSLYITHGSLLAKKLIDRVTYITDDKNEIIARRFHRALTKNLPKEAQTWVHAFHGTKRHALESILKHGLRPAGSQVDGTVVDVVAGHIKTDVEVRGIKNWAQAIFVSPSVFYAGHYVYAERVTSLDNTRWAVIIECLVKPNSFKAFPHTLFVKEDIEGEPTDVEYRIDEVSLGTFGSLSVIIVEPFNILFCISTSLPTNSPHRRRYSVLRRSLRGKVSMSS